MSKNKAIIIFLGLSLTILQGCAVFKSGKPQTGALDDSSTASVIDGALKNNIGGKEFTISRFRLNYESPGISKSTTGYIKHSKEGEILVSLRSLAGIEIARALINSDSIKVLDKINKILYVQSIDFLEMKFGLNYRYIDLIWGDSPPEILSSQTVRESENFLEIELGSGRDLLILTLDNSSQKLSEAVNLDNMLVKNRLSFGSFEEEGGIKYPGRINLNVVKENIKVDIEYRSISFEKIKNMTFKLNRAYETVVLK